MKTKPVLGEVMFVCIQAGRTGGFVCFSSRGLFFKQSLWRVFFFFKKKFLLLLLYNIYIYFLVKQNCEHICFSEFPRWEE